MIQVLHQSEFKIFIMIQLFDQLGTNRSHLRSTHLFPKSNMSDKSDNIELTPILNSVETQNTLININQPSTSNITQPRGTFSQTQQLYNLKYS